MDFGPLPKTAVQAPYLAGKNGVRTMAHKVMELFGRRRIEPDFLVSSQDPRRPGLSSFTMAVGSHVIRARGGVPLNISGRDLKDKPRLLPRSPDIPGNRGSDPY